MVTNKPTTRVQIMSQSDIMKSNNQNYKINKKIWELIENKESGAQTEELLLDFNDIKDKMGYTNIPENENLMSQIIDLQNSIEPQEDDGPTEREVSITVVYKPDVDEEPLANASVTLDKGSVSINRTTGSAGGCTATLTDGDWHIVVYRMISEEEEYSYEGPITVDESNTEFRIRAERQVSRQQEI